MPRFKALTGFRCLAACLVFLYHNRKYWKDQLHPQVFRMFNEFHIGVSLFFVLSGFLIAYTYEAQPLHSKKEYLKYFSIRLMRIMPLYWVILTAFYLDPAYGNFKFSWLTYSLFHGFSDVHNLDAISQAWSLNVEMTFYFFAPLLCLLRKKHFALLIMLLFALLMLSWAIGYGWFRLNGNPQRWLYPLRFILEGTFFGRFTEFLAGLILANAAKNHPSNWFINKLRYKTIIGFAGIFIIAWLVDFFQPSGTLIDANFITYEFIHHLLLPVFVVTALAGLMQEPTKLQQFFSSKPLQLLGNASFAFYLVHISYINLRIKGWFLLPDRNFIVLWLVAILLYLCIEKPVYTWFRKRISKT